MSFIDILNNLLTNQYSYEFGSDIELDLEMEFNQEQEVWEIETDE